MSTDVNKIIEALNNSLKNGSYTPVFLDDIARLVDEQISPEVILREIRVLECIEKPLLKLEVEESIPVWIGDIEIEYNRSPSATKGATQFNIARSPIKGLWHKHYYVDQEFFRTTNVANQNKKLPDAPPLMAMVMRLTEGKITGEWIIFKSENGVNTYLCLAKHTDGDANQTVDEVIFQRIKEFL